MNQPKIRCYRDCNDGSTRRITLFREFNPLEQVKWHKLLPYCPISQWLLEDGSIISIADDAWRNAGWKWSARVMLPPVEKE